MSSVALIFYRMMTIPEGQLVQIPQEAEHRSVGRAASSARPAAGRLEKTAGTRRAERRLRVARRQPPTRGRGDKNEASAALRLPTARMLEVKEHRDLYAFLLRSLDKPTLMTCTRPTSAPRTSYPTGRSACLELCCPTPDGHGALSRDPSFGDLLPKLRCKCCGQRPAPVYLVAGHHRTDPKGPPPCWAVELGTRSGVGQRANQRIIPGSDEADSEGVSESA